MPPWTHLTQTLRLCGAVMFVAAGLSTTHAATLDLSSATTDAKNEQNSFVKENAFDGSLSTRWAGDPIPSWIWVDLGGERRVFTVTINWEGAAGEDYELYTLRKAQKDADPGFNGNEGDTVTLSNWTSVASVTGATSGGRTDTFDFVNGTVTAEGTTSISNLPTANYLLLHITETTFVHSVSSLYELTVDASEIRPSGTVVTLK